MAKPTPVVSLALGAVALMAIVAVLVLSDPRRSGTAAPQEVASHSPTPNGHASRSPVASAHSSAEPSQATAAASPERPPPSPTDTCCSPAPTLPADLPTPVPGESLAESDDFWDHWAVFPHFKPPFLATSVAENVEFAHLVIRGHIVDVYIGEEIEYSDPDLPPSQAVAYVTVAIGEVLKGAPVSRTPGYVEVQLGYSPPELDGIRANLPQHDALWFLMHEETIRPRPPEHDSEIAPFAYFGSNDLQGVIRNVDGDVRVIKPNWIKRVFGKDFFPLPLEGTSFDDLVDQVRGI